MNLCAGNNFNLDSVLRKNDVPVIFKRIVGAGHGGGGFDSDSAKNTVINFFNQYLSPTITNVKAEPIVIKDFELYQNYPNPFNPSTVISWQLAVSYVTLKVYDMLGKEIKTLVNEQKSAGKYQFLFNGENLVSGVYYYQLSTGKYVETKKFVLTK